MGASIQEGRKTQSSRAPQEAVEVGQETKQPEEFVDIDTIPSPFAGPIDPTLVVEERQGPTTSSMEFDPTNSMQGHLVHNIGNSPKIVMVEGAQ